MTSGAAAKYLWDARRTAERIARFTAGHGPESYRADELLHPVVRETSEREAVGA